MNESAAKETEGKDRELSDEEMEEAQVSGGTGDSASEGKLPDEDANKFNQQHYLNRVPRP